MGRNTVLFRGFAKTCLRGCKWFYTFDRKYHQLTQHSKEAEKDPNVKCTVEVSYLEIYNGRKYEIYD